MTFASNLSREAKAIGGIAIVSLFLGGLILSIERPIPTDAHGHDHGHSHDDHAHSEGAVLATHVAISPDAARAAGVETRVAGPAKIAETVPVMGSIVLDPAGHARVNARFPGIVREMRKNVGDTVDVGETIASVESNESLQAYQVRSPIPGAVIARNRNVGEVTTTDPIYEIANLNRVFAELHVFSKDLSRVVKGQKVRVTSSDGAIAGEGVIGALLPVAEASSQSVLARVMLENIAGSWRPGMAVRADIVVGETDVGVALHVSAVQEVNTQQVAFIVSGNEFEVRPLLLGKSDGEWIEVQEGVYEGDVYAAKNSYLFKADLGKATAEHEH